MMLRMHKFARYCLPVLFGIVLITCAGAAEPKKGKQGAKRPLKITHWMDGVVRYHYTGLRRKLDTGPGPTDDEGWKRLEMHAAILNETSYVLVEDGRSRDEVWRKAASETLRAESARLVAAIKDKDLANARIALKQMGQSCVSCHKIHRPEK